MLLELVQLQFSLRTSFGRRSALKRGIQIKLCQKIIIITINGCFLFISSVLCEKTDMVCIWRSSRLRLKKIDEKKL